MNFDKSNDRPCDLILTFGWSSWYGIKTQECAICHFSFLPLGLHSCVTPPISRLLRNREILHLNPEYGSVPRHGSHEDCGGHAVRSAWAEKHSARVQHSSKVNFKNDFYFERHQNTVQTHNIHVCCVFVATEEVLQSVKVLTQWLIFHSQSFEHDANCCGTPLWTHGGRVADKWGTDSQTVDDRVGDTEASKGKFPPRAAGEVQEFFPNGQQKRRGGTLWRPASGCGFLWAAQWILQLAATLDRHHAPTKHDIHENKPPEWHYEPYWIFLLRLSQYQNFISFYTKAKRGKKTHKMGNSFSLINNLHTVQVQKKSLNTYQHICNNVKC